MRLRPIPSALRVPLVVLLLAGFACVSPATDTARRLAATAAPTAEPPTPSPTATVGPTATVTATAQPTARPARMRRSLPRVLVSEPVGEPARTAEPRVQAASHSPRASDAAGRIEIPAIGLLHDVYEGTEMSTINRGPGRHTETSRPGYRGNTAYAGHRTTYSRPFRHIDRLGAGDQVIFHMPSGRHVYEVYESFVVEPHETWILHQTSTDIVTLYACHPPGSARYRYVVRGRLVSGAVNPTPAPTPKPTPTPTPKPTRKPILPIG